MGDVVAKDSSSKTTIKCPDRMEQWLELQKRGGQEGEG
jgi:hypothetical protein